MKNPYTALFSAKITRYTYNWFYVLKNHYISSSTIYNRPIIAIKISKLR